MKWVTIHIYQNKLLSQQVQFRIIASSRNWSVSVYVRPLEKYTRENRDIFTSDMCVSVSVLDMCMGAAGK